MPIGPISRRAITWRRPSRYQSSTSSGAGACSRWARWGFLPSWVKDPRTFSLLVNARGESVNDKPAFRSAMRRRRCLIPADGFYEWSDTRRRRPFFVRPKDGRSIAFAGLWETWSGPSGEEVDTAAIVTTRSNRQLAAIHDRCR